MVQPRKLRGQGAEHQPARDLAAVDHAYGENTDGVIVVLPPSGVQDVSGRPDHRGEASWNKFPP